MQYPTDEMEFRQQWSACSGRLSGIRFGIVEAENRSAEAYVMKRDEVASALRDLATRLKSFESEERKILAGFIKESQKR